VRTGGRLERLRDEGFRRASGGQAIARSLERPTGPREGFARPHEGLHVAVRDIEKGTVSTSGTSWESEYDDKEV
jgi:hypothetical protein